MIAENKLKAQKLFRKSLETVQNVSNNLEQGALKSAFINPNFQNKLQAEGINPAVSIMPAQNNYHTPCAVNHISQSPVLNQNVFPVKPSVSLTHLLPPPIASSMSEKHFVPSINISQSNDDFILPSVTMDLVSLPHVNIPPGNQNHTRPVIGTSETDQSVSDESKETLPSQTPPRIAENVGNDVSESEINALPITSQAKGSIQERCAFWPDCKNQSCSYIHPSINCKLFPNCSFGQRCIYLHPPCMFGNNCSNPTCPFTHLPSAPSVFAGFSQICKFYPNCTKVDCAFMHVPKPCRFGTACTKPDCVFSHDKPPLSVSPLKWVAGKPHVSERKFAADDAVVSQIPVSIVTSQTLK